MHLVLASLHEPRGDTRPALAAVRRRHYHWHPHGAAYRSTHLREEGRLATLVGDRAGAIRAYRHYLALRSAPEPGLRAEAERVAAELARITRGR